MLKLLRVEIESVSLIVALSSSELNEFTDTISGGKGKSNSSRIASILPLI